MNRGADLPDSSLCYAIFPFDCPTCYMGFQVAHQELEPQFRHVYWLFPSIDTADLGFFIHEHFDISIPRNRVIISDSLFNSWNPEKLSAVLLLSGGKVRWRTNLKDMGSFTASKNPFSETYVPMKMESVGWCYKSTNQDYYYLSDSTALLRNYLRDELQLMDVTNRKMKARFVVNDSALLLYLIKHAAISAKARSFNLGFVLNRPGSIASKYGLPPVRSDGLSVTGQDIWLGITVLIVDESFDQTLNVTKETFNQYKFLLRFNRELKLENLFPMSQAYPNTHVWSSSGDINLVNGDIYVSNSTNHDDSLISRLRPDYKHNTLRWLNLYPQGFPAALPKMSPGGIPYYYPIHVIADLQQQPLVYYDQGFVLCRPGASPDTSLSSNLDSLAKAMNMLFIAGIQPLPESGRYLLILGGDKKRFAVYLNRQFRVVSAPILVSSEVTASEMLPGRRFSCMHQEKNDFRLDLFRLY